MADVTGALRLKANGAEYTLWMGTSVLAALQGLHGQDALAKLEQPDDAPEGWIPDLQVIHDLIRLSLERYHEDADRWLVDDILAQNVDVLPKLMAGSMPDPDTKAAAAGNERPRRAKPR